jgi:hypothetical protein
MNAGLLFYIIAIMVGTSTGRQMERGASWVGRQIDRLLKFIRIAVLVNIKVQNDVICLIFSNKTDGNSLATTAFPFELHMDFDITGLGQSNLLIVRGVQERDGDMTMVVVILTGRHGHYSESDDWEKEFFHGVLGFI